MATRGLPAPAATSGRTSACRRTPEGSVATPPRAAAQQAAGGGTGGAVVFDRHRTVHQHVAIADGALHPAPLSAGKIVRLLDRSHCQVLEVVDHDVRRSPLLEGAAVGEPGAVRRQGRELPMYVLEGEDVVVARCADDRLGWVAARGEKARV